jgi:TetR/AcrR family transcriptional regulator
MRPARVSPDRILTAAAAEFAARGYAGARVDRIARRARVNKAMLYYYFGSKQAIYRTLLRQVFAGAAARLNAIAAMEMPAADKIDQVIQTIAAFMAEHAFFPSIMLREIAEGGAHLDPETLRALASVPAAIARIVHDGVRRKTVRAIHPVAAYFTMMAPLVMYLGGGPIRTELTAHHLIDLSSLTPDRFVRELQQSMRLALAVPPARRSSR